MTAIETLPEVIRRIVAVSQPERIILFGSWAKGTNNADSDLDLLVIAKESFGPERSRYTEIGRIERALGRLPYPTDILLYSREEVRHWQSSANHVIAKALREGREIYARH